LSNWTPAQWFAGIAGLLLLVGGVCGLTVVDGGDVFSEGGDIEGDDLLIFEVNGWLSLFWLVTGAIGVITAIIGAGAAKQYAGIAGLVLLVVAVWGIIDDNTVADIFTVNREDNLLHLGLGLIGLDAAMLSGPGKRYRKVSR